MTVKNRTVAKKSKKNQQILKALQVRVVKKNTLLTKT